jgi:subtilisin family serine protease
MLMLVPSLWAGSPSGLSPRVRGREQASHVLIKGRKANDGRILAEVAPQADMKSLAMFQERVARRFKNFPDCVVIESSDAGKLSTLSKVRRAELLALRIKKLKASGLFTVVEPDWVVQVQATPSDAAFTDGRLWGLHNVGQSGGVADADIDAPEAWDITTGSPSVTVGVVDTGIRYTHQDLSANMWVNPGEVPGNSVDDDSNGFVDDVYGINAITRSGDPMDDNGHGSHCAGTVGAVANGGGAHVGVAWNVRLMALKFLAADGSGYSSDAITCIDYAIDKGVDILSNSWGGGGYSSAMASAIQRAQAAGILFVAAAGNESNDNDSGPSYPASYTMNNVIAVAALDRSDQLASFSNYGATSVDLGAPGVSIFSCVSASDSSYGTYNGTSMATPHVSGVAALLKAQFPSISLAELRQRLLSTTVTVPALAGRCVTGGRVNAANALSASPDGIMEVSVTAERSPLVASEANVLYTRVSDMTPVLGATVVGGFAGLPTAPFLDNGTAPDASANDGIYSASLPAPAVSGFVDAIVSVTAAGKSPATVTNTFSIVGRPGNDDFSAREPIAAGVTTVSGSNRNATSEPGEPSHTYGAGTQTVWWQWVAPETATVTLSTLGSNFDTILAVFTGSSLGGLALIGANDDSSGLQSAVQFAAQAGTTYAIQVNGYSTASGDIQLNLPAVAGAPTITDEPNDTTVLVGNPFVLQVTAAGQAPLQYQWYFEGTALGGATGASYSDAAALLEDEGLYHVVVSNATGSATSRQAFVAVEQTELNPDNDHFYGGRELAGMDGRLTDENSLATGQAGEPDHAGVAMPLASLWYHWTAPRYGSLVVNTYGSDFDTVLAAYQGNTVSALTTIAANDDAVGLQSEIAFSVVAGERYWLAVDGYADASGTVALDYRLTADSTPVLIIRGDGAMSFTAQGGTGSFDLFANREWGAFCDAPWITITAGHSGTDDATVSYAVAPNADMAARRATIWVPITAAGAGAGEDALVRIFTVSQAGQRLSGEAGWAPDFDGDGRADLYTVEVTGTSAPSWQISFSSGGTQSAAFGTADSLPLSGDFNGDGRDDVAVFESGEWSISTDYGNSAAYYHFGDENSIPVPADYDGDGVTDLGVYQRYAHPLGAYMAGQWYQYSLVRGYLGTAVWGNYGYAPASADYDGDGLADMAVHDPVTGLWYVHYSSAAARASSRSVFVWGNSSSDYLAGDFNGDLSCEFTVYDHATVLSSQVDWYISSAANAGALALTPADFGDNSYTPVIGDFDADGINDYTVYKDGQWYIWLSSEARVWSPVFGNASAFPIPQFHK